MRGRGRARSRRVLPSGPLQALASPQLTERIRGKGVGKREGWGVWCPSPPCPAAFRHPSRNHLFVISGSPARAYPGQWVVPHSVFSCRRHCGPPAKGQQPLVIHGQVVIRGPFWQYSYLTPEAGGSGAHPWFFMCAFFFLSGVFGVSWGCPEFGFILRVSVAATLPGGECGGWWQGVRQFLLPS